MPPTMANSNEGQYHKDKYFNTSSSKDLATGNNYVQYGSSSILFLRSYDQCHFFLYQPLVKCQGQKFKNLQKDLIKRDIHVKYQSYSTQCSKVISKVKVFQKWVKLQGQGHRVKNNGTH